MGLAPDPPIPEDGSCAVCGKQRGGPGLRPLYAKAVAADPFCSAPCARLWHGVPLPTTPQVKPRGYVSSLPPAA